MAPTCVAGACGQAHSFFPNLRQVPRLHRHCSRYWGSNRPGAQETPKSGGGGGGGWGQTSVHFKGGDEFSEGKEAREGD